MATATVEMVVCINVEVDVSDDTTYKQFYDKAAEAAKDAIRAFSRSGMEMRSINEIKSVVSSKSNRVPVSRKVPDVVDNTK